MPLILQAQNGKKIHIQEIEKFVVEEPRITSHSTSGKYFSCEVRDSKRIITSIYRNNIKLKEFNRAFDALSFETADKYLIANQSDSLVLYTIPTFKPKVIATKVTKSLALTYNNSTFLIYSTNENQLIFNDIVRGKSDSVNNIVDYRLLPKGNLLVFRKKSSLQSVIEVYNIQTSKSHLVWAGGDVPRSKIITGPKSGSFLFITDAIIDGNSIERLFLYNKEKDSVIRIGDDEKFKQKQIGDLGFVGSESSIYYSLKLKSNPLPKLGANVSIWRYKDNSLQLAQAASLTENHEDMGTFVYHIESNALRQVKFPNFSFRWFDTRMATKDRVLLSNEVDNFGYENSDKLWFDSYKKDKFLRIWNLKTNDTCEVSLETPLFELYGFSPDGNYLLWFDYNKQQLVSYNTLTKTKTYADQNVSKKLTSQEALSNGRFRTWGLAGWIPADNSILLYDEFDILQFSYDGKFIRNITNGLGKTNGISFLIVSKPGDHDLNTRTYLHNEELILAGLQRKTKMGGYWRWKLSSSNNLDLKSLKPYSIESRSQYLGVEWDIKSSIISLANNNGYLVNRSTASTYNLFYTKDLINYKSIITIDPGKTHDWLTAELVNWKMLDGRMSQGILYKPNDMDPNKKYPVIFNYYEKRSQEFHKFLSPGYSQHNINIPSFVNQGYLIFVPDIFHTSGKNGEGTYNALESAAIHLSKFSYVDSARLGLQGHSFGGWQTNYMITHSNRFAAACEASGVANVISGYGQISWGTARHKFYELNSQGSPYGFGVTPWTNREIYINNSPIFKIDKVTTPLLMMHGDQDLAVPFSQATELFTSMQRAGKKVWFLQYHDAGHQLDGENAIDYHKRMLQFFNHYLKGEHAPFWMTKGISAVDRQYTEGLDLDMSTQLP